MLPWPSMSPLDFTAKRKQQHPSFVMAVAEHGLCCNNVIQKCDNHKGEDLQTYEMMIMISVCWETYMGGELAQP